MSFRDAVPRECFCAADESACDCSVGNPLSDDDGVFNYDFQLETPDFDDTLQFGVAPMNFPLRLITRYLAGDAADLKVRKPREDDSVSFMPLTHVT